ATAGVARGTSLHAPGALASQLRTQADLNSRAHRATSTTGTNSAVPVLGNPTQSLRPARLRSSTIHLRSWLAFTPALSASPATDAPGCSHASISRRLPSGSKQRRPP